LDAVGEDRRSKYKSAIAHSTEVIAELRKEEYESLRKHRCGCSVVLAIHLLRHSADNEDEAFAMVHDGLDQCVDLLRREVLINMGTEYRKLHKWDQSIQAFISSPVPLQLDREVLLFRMGTWYRTIHKWKQSIQAFKVSFESICPRVKTRVPSYYD
jgi:hypothetical protein